jgi:hypothetical protein
MQARVRYQTSLNSVNVQVSESEKTWMVAEVWSCIEI